MDEIKFKFFLNKICKVWTKDNFFRQGKIIDISDSGIVINDRYDGMTYIDSEFIQNIKEVKGNDC